MRNNELLIQKGNISVTMALSLVVLLVFFALAIDGGHAYMTKQKYQDGVEMAAMAAAWDILSDPHATAVLVAKENGLPLESSDFLVTVGYYDTGDQFEDFEGYKNFMADSNPATNENDALSTEETPVLNNAVIVSMEINASTLMASFMGKRSVAITAQAMAYGKRYTYLALGKKGVDPNNYWEKGYALFQNGIIGSNGNVDFAGTERFRDNIYVEALGKVTGDNGKVPVRELESKITVPPIDWIRLRQEAEENGKVFTPEKWTEDWKRGNWVTDDGYTNCYHKATQDGKTYYQFIPAPGDHGGRTYYFDLPSDDDSILLNIFNPTSYYDEMLNPEDRQVWNFTIACPCGVSSYPVPKSGPYDAYTQWGNVPEYGEDGIVRIFCKEMDEYSKRWYTRYAGLPLTEPKGVMLRMDGRFEMYAQASVGTFWLRVVADSIEIHSPDWRKSSVIIDGGFGPPDLVRLAELEVGE